MTRTEIDEDKNCPNCNNELQPVFLEVCHYCFEVLCWKCCFDDHPEEAGDHYYCSKECYSKCT